MESSKASSIAGPATSKPETLKVEIENVNFVLLEFSFFPVIDGFGGSAAPLFCET